MCNSLCFLVLDYIKSLPSHNPQDTITDIRTSSRLKNKISLHVPIAEYKSLESIEKGHLGYMAKTSNKNHKEQTRHSKISD